MKIRHRKWALSLLVAGATSTAHADAKLSSQEAQDLIDRYCVSCHNVTDWAGGIALDTVPLDDFVEHAPTWEGVVRKLRGRLMPPPGNTQPSAQQLASTVSWLEQQLDQSVPSPPGRVGLRRLNRAEYASSVRDLLGVHIDAPALLPADDLHHGYDNVADALQVSPMFLDQYLSAARSVALMAVGNPSARALSTIYGAPSDMKAYADIQGVEKRGIVGSGTQRFHIDGLPFGTRGGMVVEHLFPADGEYSLTIGELAAGRLVPNMEFEHTVIALLDNEEFFRSTLGGPLDMKSIDQGQDPAADVINERFKDIRFHAKAGQRRLAVTFVQRSFAESDDRIRTLSPEGGQDRQPLVHAMQIRGPLQAQGVSESASRRKIFKCKPSDVSQEEACARSIVTALAERAFRRPLTQTDEARLMRFYSMGRQEGDFDAGIRQALTAILASPHFLYRAEAGSDVGQQAQLLSDLELASRLAFFLWSSLPDDELRNAAVRGELRDPTSMEQHVRRMLRDPRAESLTTRFAFQWLNVAKLDEIVPDPAIFPYASGQLDPRPMLREELRLFIDSVFRSDASVTQLLTADYTFLNQQLAAHYGINNVKGNRFRRVTLNNSARYGLLGKGAVLMLTAYPNRTAPVLRGAWILERLLATPPAPPPPNVEALKENEPGAKALSVRELVAQHSENPSCFSCHGVMDPLGFALENFDAVGQFRERDRVTRELVDASGVLPDGTALTGPDDLRRALVANSEQFVQALTENLLIYALGRALDHRDMPLVRRIVKESAAHDYRLEAIILQIVNSDAFRMREAISPNLPDLQVSTRE